MGVRAVSPLAGVYEWPALVGDSDPTDDDQRFADWAYAVRDHLEPVFQTMSGPLPDDPVELDKVVTEHVDGWLPRVTFLAVRAEYYLNRAKAAKWPPQITADGEKLTAGEREARYDSALAPYRFVRDELDGLAKRMSERVRWSQSVRRVHQDAQ